MHSLHIMRHKYLCRSGRTCISVVITLTATFFFFVILMLGENIEIQEDYCLFQVFFLLCAGMCLERLLCLRRTQRILRGRQVHLSASSIPLTITVFGTFLLLWTYYQWYLVCSVAQWFSWKEKDNFLVTTINHLPAFAFL